MIPFTLGPLGPLGKTYSNLLPLLSAQHPERVGRRRHRNFIKDIGHNSVANLFVNKTKIFEKQVQKSLQKVDQFHQVALEKLENSKLSPTLQKYTNLSSEADSIPNEIDLSTLTQSPSQHLFTWQNENYVCPYRDFVKDQLEQFRNLPRYALMYWGNHKYKVVPGDIIAVPKMNAKVGEKIVCSKVGLVATQNYTWIGRPLIKYARIEATVLEQTFTPKTFVTNKKPRQRTKTRKSWKHPITKLSIDAIHTNYFESSNGIPHTYSTVIPSDILIENPQSPTIPSSFGHL